MEDMEDFPGLIYIPCAVQVDPSNPNFGWIYVPHVDGQWVSLTKLDKFSFLIIQEYLKKFEGI